MLERGRGGRVQRWPPEVEVIGLEEREQSWRERDLGVTEATYKP